MHATSTGLARAWRRRIGKAYSRPKKVKEKRMETRLSLTILLSNLYSTNFSRVLASYD